MLTYSDVNTWLTDRLEEMGYATVLPLIAGDGSKPMPLLDPGPVSLPRLFAKTPGTMVIATVGNGAGLTLEHLYDQVFITVRVLGPQFDYEGAESLAMDVDRAFLSITTPTLIGSTRVLFVNRTGGAPQLIDLDDTDRYHFQTTYITPAATGL